MSPCTSGNLGTETSCSKQKGGPDTNDTSACTSHASKRGRTPSVYAMAPCHNDSENVPTSEPGCMTPEPLLIYTITVQGPLADVWPTMAVEFLLHVSTKSASFMLTYVRYYLTTSIINPEHHTTIMPPKASSQHPSPRQHHFPHSFS